MALREFGPTVLAAGKHLMVLSVGALIGVLDDWTRLAEKHGCRILVPAGAIARLDGVKAAREGAITSVTMEPRQPPRGSRASYIESGTSIWSHREETRISRPARRREGLPANVNGWQPFLGGTGRSALGSSSSDAGQPTPKDRITVRAVRRARLEARKSPRPIHGRSASICPPIAMLASGGAPPRG